MSDDNDATTHPPGAIHAPLVIASRFTIRMDRRDEFLDLADRATGPTRQAEGVVSYGCYEEPRQPNSFIFFEEWSSREHFATHLQTPHVQELMERLPDLVDGDAETRIYDVNRVTHGLDVVD